MLAFMRDNRTDAKPAVETGRLDGLTSAMTAAGIGYWIYSAAAKTLQTSPGLEAIYGAAFPAETALDALFDQFCRDESGVGSAVSELRAASWAEALAGGAQFDEEHLIKRADGQSVWIRSIVSAERSADGAVQRIFGLSIDIDDQRRRELANAKAGEQIAEESRQKTDFLTTMSHEIRTPLNGVLGIAQLLERTELDPKQSGYVKSIRASGDAMLSLLNNALDLSKIEKGLVELTLAPTDLPALAQEIVDSARGQAVAKGLALEVRLDPALERWRLADGARLRQIIANLVFNALKFTDKGSVTVALTPAQTEGSVKISVVDTGPGVPEAEQADIFERFRQTKAEASRGGDRGTGLGLSICLELARLMGGQLGLQSKLGAGSTFWAELPLAPAPQAAESDANSAAPAGAAGGRAFENEQTVRILIAEDDPTNRQVFEGALEPTGYQLVMVENGLEALEKIETERFDLILMDHNMPKMSGDEAILKIRASDEAWRDVPIIVVSALTHRDARKRFREVGANDYLPKPLEIDALLKKVTAIINAKNH